MELDLMQDGSANTGQAVELWLDLTEKESLEPYMEELREEWSKHWKQEGDSVQNKKMQQISICLIITQNG